jgi:hypothetical protein
MTQTMYITQPSAIAPNSEYTPIIRPSIAAELAAVAAGKKLLTSGRPGRFSGRVDSILRAMAHASTAAPPKDKDLTRTYALVILTEIVVILALVWLGAYFG